MFDKIVDIRKPVRYNAYISYRTSVQCIVFERRNIMIITSSGRRFINYRRRQMIMRRIVMIISVFVCSIIFSLFASKVVTNAKSSDDVQYYKYYTSIVVEPGDSLTSLAEEYGEHFDSSQQFINEVIFSNHLLNDKLVTGMSLIVPYYSTEFK